MRCILLYVRVIQPEPEPNKRRLSDVQVLSLSNNRLEDIQAVTALRALRILRVDRNRITRVPASLSSLRDLTVLDVSHNRLEAVPPALADLAARLYRCALNSANYSKRSLSK